jgi:hypothetical protein
MVNIQRTFPGADARKDVSFLSFALNSSFQHLSSTIRGNDHDPVGISQHPVAR